MDEKIKANTMQADSESAGDGTKKQRFRLFTSMWGFLSKFFSFLGNLISGSKATDGITDNNRKVQSNAIKKKPIGLVSLIRMAGKVTGFLLKSAWKYVGYPLLVEPLVELPKVLRGRNMDHVFNKTKQVEPKSDFTVCPKIRLENENKLDSSKNHLLRQEKDNTCEMRYKQDKEHSKRDNCKNMKL